MAGEIQIVIVGNLTRDPELRLTPTGVSVVNFSVASTPRTFKDGEWKDGEATFIRCQAWRTMADNIAETLSKGSRVVVMGKFQQRSYEKDGEKHTTYEMLVDDIGPSIKFHPAKISKATRESSTSQSNGGANDPWATATPAGVKSSGNGGYDDDPPF